MSNVLRISDDLKEKMLSYSISVFGKVISPRYNILDFNNVHFDKDKGKKMIEYLSPYIDIKHEFKILDAGCGGGLSVVGMRKLGHIAFGYEIDKKVFAIANQLLIENNLASDIISLVPEDYERLPYQDNAFDIICSNFVLEHVRHPVHYLAELRRVLKKNGRLIILCPNYLIPYETHYGLPFVPFSRLLNLRIILWRKRDPSMFYDFSFPTPKIVEGWINSVGFIGENMSVKYSNNFIQGKDNNGRSNLAIDLIKILRKLNLIGLVNYIMKLGFYNPLFFILIKKEG